METTARPVPTHRTAAGDDGGQRRRSAGWSRSTIATDDLSHGQIVIVVAKWILVLAGMVLVLWAPADVGQLRIQIMVLLLLAVENFYHHAQLLKRRPVPDIVAYGASAADLLVVSTLIVMQGGFDSRLFIFYFPALVAVSLAFRPKTTVMYCGITIGIYAAISLADLLNHQEVDNAPQILLVRLLMLASVGFCGAASWNLEARRRQTRGAVPGVPARSFPAELS